MIELKTENGHCELTMSGTGAELTEDMRVIIHAAYNAIIKSVPEFSKNAYANFYRIALMKAITECTPHTDFNSSYPHDIKP